MTKIEKHTIYKALCMYARAMECAEKQARAQEKYSLAACCAKEKGVANGLKSIFPKIEDEASGTVLI